MTVKKWHKVIFHGTWMSPSPQRHSSCSQAQLRSICSAQGCETASGHLPESGKKRGFKTPPEIWKDLPNYDTMLYQSKTIPLEVSRSLNVDDGAGDPTW